MDKEDVVYIYIYIYTHTMKYYSVIKRSETVSFAETWMGLQTVTQ